jgi:hypothetical protein
LLEGRVVTIGPAPWKVAYKPTDRRREPASRYPCALAHWGDYCTPQDLAAQNKMVWDHSHIHGYIRGPLCSYHNGRMKQYDHGWERYLYEADLIEYARRCAGCMGPW